MQSVAITTEVVNCEFEPHSRQGVQHYVIKFVSYLRQVGGFLRAIRFPSPIKTDCHNIHVAEILLKVALNTTNQTSCPKMIIKSLDWALNVRIGSYRVSENTGFFCLISHFCCKHWIRKSMINNENTFCIQNLKLWNISPWYENLNLLVRKYKFLNFIFR